MTSSLTSPSARDAYISPQLPTIGGVPSGAVPIKLATLVSERGAAAVHVHVVHSDKRAAELCEAIPFFAPNAQVLYFPAWDVLPYDRVSPNPSIITERLQTLVALLHPTDSPRIVVTTAAAFSQCLPPKAVLQEHVWQMQAGAALDREALRRWLSEHGYQANSKAVESGEFAMRGSIIDIIPSGSEMGFRVDLFGDDIESIKQFDPLTQRSEQEVQQLSLLPASEVLLTQQHIQHFRSAYRDAFGAISHADPFYEAISSGQRWPGMEHWLPLFYKQLDTLADYASGAHLTIDTGIMDVLAERQEMISEAYQARVEAAKIKAFGTEPYHPISPGQLYLANQPARLFAYPHVAQFSHFVDRAEKGDIYSSPHLNFTSEGQAKNPLKKLKEWMAGSARADKKILLTCFSVGSRERLLEMLANHGVSASRVERFSAFNALAPGSCAVAHLPLTEGVETSDFTLITEEQLLGERMIRTKRKKRDADYFMAEAATFEPGELVVHKEHGIGRFELLETISAAGAVHDCLKLTYAGDDRLFLPVENIDMLSRYGSDSDGVELDRLGASNWQARKAKMKERIGEIAAALMKTAAERALKPGEVLGADQLGYQEFAARFGYTETEDQERAIEQVEQDLLSGKPMDRLVCGDVGFGKTEVALRAAYIAVSSDLTEAALCEEGDKTDRHQVALIVPTTLLARQHYQNFKARFAGFGIKVAQLSRMASAKEAKHTKEGLANGSVDIVIGTHALLSKDIQFNNLGLIIVDEEQRFGVTQKEKLKALKSDVHVLTLTATPIPRTLQLSLSGVRDLSLITTPPVDRLAVRTYVMPFDPVVLREALMREKNRQGGSFIVTPRVADIGELKARVKAIAPELNIEVAHGQMPSGELDDMMNRFYDRKIDVLISTTIIESGLDVPHANTMIIHKADRFGLAQLYQLRGRVGRSKTRAYAYLLLPQGKTLSRQATKRLEVMQTLDRLGAGFQLASHDMDIRGFGNLVGDEQSGHIREVGVELYQQMLQDEIEKLKTRAAHKGNGGNKHAARNDAPVPAAPPSPEPADDLSPAINLGMSVLIPEYYVEDLSLRMGLYRRIGSASSEPELDSMAAEMIDRFGPLPGEVQALFTTMRFKWLCKQLRIARLDAGPKGVVMHFAALDEARAAKLISFLSQHPTIMKMRPDQSVFIKDEYRNEADKIIKIGALLKVMLEEVAG